MLSKEGVENWGINGYREVGELGRGGYKVLGDCRIFDWWACKLARVNSNPCAMLIFITRL